MHGPLITRYVKLQVAHAPGMSRTFSPAAEFKGNRELAIPTCITARASSPCRDVCRDCLPVVAGKTFPGFPAHAHTQSLRPFGGWGGGGWGVGVGWGVGWVGGWGGGGGWGGWGGGGGGGGGGGQIQDGKDPRIDVQQCCMSWIAIYFEVRYLEHVSLANIKPLI